MKVLLKAASQYQLADCDFATGAEIDAVARWRRQFRGLRDQGSADALEFALLARKRWRSYVHLGRTVQSIAALQERIADDPAAEVAMFAALVLPGASRQRLRGFCLFRRTWRNHLIVDLLAATPVAAEEIAGIGAGLVYFVASIADSIKAPFIWGEATEWSFGFYQQLFRVPVDDLFRIEAPVYRQFQKRYLARWLESGLPPR